MAEISLRIDIEGEDDDLRALDELLADAFEEFPGQVTWRKLNAASDASPSSDLTTSLEDES